MVSLSFVVLVLFTVWGVYWILIRPSVLDQVEVDFERLRSTVDWAMIERLPESQSRPALRLARDLESSSAARVLSMSVIIYGIRRHGARLRAQFEMDKQISQEVPQWIRDARAENVRLTMKAALANSPVWWIPLAALLLATYFSRKTAMWWADFQNAGSVMRSEGLAA